MTFLAGTGRHPVQIIYFFRTQIGARTRSGIDLGSGGPLDRMRRCSGLSRELWIENFGGSWSRAVERKGPCLYVSTDGSARVRGVGVCARLVPTLSGPRDTSGPQMDRISQLQPPHYTANSTRAPAVQKRLSKRSPWICPHQTPSTRHSRKSNSLRRAPP